MPHFVDGVDVGGPRPKWADGFTAANAPCVDYPHGVKMTDGEHEALKGFEAHAQSGVIDDRAFRGAVQLVAVPETPEAPGE